MEVRRQMPLYEVLLIRDDEQETRLTDRSMRVGETVSISEQSWLVQSKTAPERADAAARYVCVPAKSAG